LKSTRKVLITFKTVLLPEVRIREEKEPPDLGNGLLPLKRATAKLLRLCETAGGGVHIGLKSKRNGKRKTPKSPAKGKVQHGGGKINGTEGKKTWGTTGKSNGWRVYPQIKYQTLIEPWEKPNQKPPPPPTHTHSWWRGDGEEKWGGNPQEEADCLNYRSKRTKKKWKVREKSELEKKLGKKKRGVGH